MINISFYNALSDELKSLKVELVAVSKTKPVEDILELYHSRQRIFGENYVQELKEKSEQLPKDILWHFIGHLQTNKVKYIAPFVSCIQSVDSLKLLNEINKEAAKNNRIIDCFLQVYIAKEETKFGLSFEEADEILKQIINGALNNISITGMMAMASFSNDFCLVRNEFKSLKNYFESAKLKFSSPAIQLKTLCMGMTSDYKIAIEEGSNMVRIGSAIFGDRK
ncbi:MAG TPA: YggS family pyridoxal phosphate-dependent enzyme [Bacteroidia bacterium]|nr:YggS family pyridoxal phosphate-dependent enzyme [Bacteroidia bacterium]